MRLRYDLAQTIINQGLGRACHEREVSPKGAMVRRQIRDIEKYVGQDAFNNELARHR